MTAFFLLLSSIAVSMLVIPLACRVAPRLGMVDQPDPRKVHSHAVPRVGGWGIAAGCLLPLLLEVTDRLMPAFAAGMMVLFVFGAWDDARQISHWPKFAGQLIAVGLVVFWGGLYVTRLPFVDGDVLGPWSGRVFTLVAMVGAINAVNHSDGLDGLAAGETLLSLIAMAFLGYLVGAPLATNLALVAIGGIFGFLRYNTHPARVFMGDAGSQVLGFTTAFLVVYLVQQANRAASAALPLLLLGLPIADILVVLYKRAAGGMNWFKATRNHVHHRLLDLGFSHFQTVVVIYSLQALLVISAVLLRYTGDGVVITTYLVAVVALFAALAWAERVGWQRTGARHIGPQDTGTWSARWQHDATCRRALLWFIAATVSSLCLLTTLWVQEVPQDFGAIALLTAVGLAAAYLSRPQVRPLALRISAYVAVSFVAWLFTHHPRSEGVPLAEPATWTIIGLALALAVFVRFGSDRRFETTPTDYLIAFALLALLLFARVTSGGLAARDMLQFIGFAVVLFYGCEVIIGYLERWRSLLGASTFATLLIVALRGLSGHI